ncbi:MFS transporter [Kaistia dalseonensis]|uniref:Fucose permease n=1 Tax=Kaistia dalseonensis TaxID=410840 RepID=A0ABU0H4Z1_9HYPH|nr:MFS transporter [Kaistia dalseonensis]MCX5493965.1 MFS transporter [Kaistia dalseonensis]MDQ0436541.1 fucose permease [Kaistia dalseonensis]
MALSFASARLIMALFFVYSCALSNWLIRIPDVQHRLQLDPAALSICLLGVPVGLVISMAFSGLVVERLGPRRAIRLGFVIFLVPLLLPGFATSSTMLFFALMLVGLGMGPLEVGLNVTADRIGTAIGRTVMSRCHGFWSLGLMAGGITGSAAATFGLAPEHHMVLVVLVLITLGELLALRLPPLRPEPAAPGEKAPVFVLPPRNIILLCLFAFGMLLVEGAITDWSAIYLRDDFGAVPPVTGFAFTAFGLFMAGGRLAGDWLSMRYGPATMARICCLIGLAGIAAMVLAVDPMMVIIGAAAGGFGVSIIFPLAVTAAAARGGSPAVNVSALSLLSFTGFLVGPPVIGFVAQFAGLRFGIATLLLAAGMSLLLSGQVRVRRPAEIVEDAPVGQREAA